jgi:hypothetical protein
MQLSICQPTDRILSNIYFNLAVAYIYQSSEKDTIDPIQDKELALQNYIAARDVLVAGAKEQSTSSSGSSSTTSTANDSSSSSSSSTAGEKKNNAMEELIDELNETIEALKAEIKEVSSPH